MATNYKSYDDLPPRSDPNYQKLWRLKNREKMRKYFKNRFDNMTPEERQEKIYKPRKSYAAVYRKENRPALYESQWKKRGIVNLTWDIYQKTLKKQNNKCKVCKEDMKLPHADHKHKTGKFRALLCAGCNLSMGRYEKYKKQFEEYLK
jgi:hypothetical protein|tara:strand:+ start:163 stop:606 length:444 start_codon:yes stop_codon:yes gene_type:complete